LALSSPVNVGLVADVTNGFAQVQIDSALVQVQAQNSNEPKVIFEETRTVGSEIVDGKRRGVSVFIDNPDYAVTCPANSGNCQYGTGISRGILTRETKFKVQVIENIKSLHGDFTPIGNQVVIEVPFGAIDISTDKIAFQFLAPSFPGKYEKDYAASITEITITFDDGSIERLLLDGGTLGSPIWIHNATLDLFFREYADRPKPEILRIGVLPVRLNVRQNALPSQTLETH
jgi:hypothetical protein